ncbi:hypothetical protein SynBIOSU31_02178 [Synechococcus sp. BIOS-U3-1]|nr:hypothetical protein SynBIOSU31_02178 [Synechococcus sp. BIOS-U3-1]
MNGVESLNAIFIAGWRTVMTFVPLHGGFNLHRLRCLL